MKDVTKLFRPNIANLKAYTSARQTANADTGILLDANENPRGRYNRYPDPYSTEVRNLYSDFVGIPSSNIFAGSGSDEVIDLLFRVFCEPKRDCVITLDPTYGMYRVCADINDVQVISIMLTDDFQIDVETTLSACVPDTKIIFVCSPNNPTGNLIREQDVFALCEGFDGIVVVDEAYIEFAGDISLAKEVLGYKNLVVTRTLSKAWGAAGVRVGFAIACEEIIDALNKIKPPYNVPVPSQEIAAGVLREGFDVTSILSERDRVKSALQMFGLTVLPSDANFLVFKVPNASDIQRALQECGVVIRDRSSMPKMENCLRISIGTTYENDRFLTELAKLLKKVAFIDRDGVILSENQIDFQNDSLEKYEMLPGVIEGLRKLRKEGYMLVMVTNQDGLGTDSFPEENFWLVQDKMIRDLRDVGIEFDDVFICPHFPQDNCECRKPKIGMVRKFLDTTPMNYAASFVVGDRESDMELASNIGIRGIKGELNGNFLTTIANA